MLLAQKKPATNKQIADTLLAIDNVIKYETITDNLEQKLKDSGFKGDFFWLNKWQRFNTLWTIYLRRNGKNFKFYEKQSL